jgi:16S rRNA (guanine1207-N2)-methyltransferase
MGRGSRDERVDRLLAGVIEGATGDWLVAGDLPRSAEVLAEGGAGVARWARFGGPPARPDPPTGGYDGAVVRLPRGSDAARMVLHLVAARLRPDGVLWVGGANDEGIRSAPVDEVVRERLDARSGGHARAIGGRGPAPGLRGDLEDWAEVGRVSIDGHERTWTSWPGLFAHGRVDEGTQLLLDHLPDPAGLACLDVGTGAGLVAATLAVRGAASVDASDPDALAVHAATRNVPEARVVLGPGVPDGGPWDLVATNPPIHRGADADWSMLEDLGRTLLSRLRPGGVLVLVTQPTVPVRRLLADLAPVEVPTGSRSYRIWRGGRDRR